MCHSLLSACENQVVYFNEICTVPLNGLCGKRIVRNPHVKMAEISIFRMSFRKLSQEANVRSNILDLIIEANFVVLGVKEG